MCIRDRCSFDAFFRTNYFLLRTAAWMLYHMAVFRGWSPHTPFTALSVLPLLNSAFTVLQVSTNSVSYTHLDVYKRQTLYFSLSLITSFISSCNPLFDYRYFFFYLLADCFIVFSYFLTQFFLQYFHSSV